MKLHNIYRYVDKVSIVSFDIFDTLLLRPYMKPEDLFLHLEKIYDCPGFSEQRKNAETLFYQKYGTKKEANIDDIYKMLPEFDNIKQAEMDMEFQSLVINPEIKQIYDYALNSGKKVVICSDMYLPIQFIEKVLKKNKIADYSKIYLSNLLNLRKDRGDMYSYMVQDLNVKPHQILHIGDNKKSDFYQAKKHGIKACFYSKVSETFLHQNKKFAKFYKHQKSYLGASITTALASQKQTTGDYWEDFGYKYAGPVVYSYVRWIYETARCNGLDNILFIARDGYLMEKVFKMFSKDIKSSYVYAPRILNYTANLDYNPLSKEQPKIVCEYFHKNPGNLSYQKFIEKNVDEFRKLAREEKERTGYGEYIKKLTSHSNIIGVVDSISGQLSGQRLIEKESHTKTIGFYVLTLSGQKCVYDAEHRDYFSAEIRDLFVKDYKCDLIELIFSSPENPIITLHYGKPVRKTSVSEAELSRQKIYQKIEKGVMYFVQDVFNKFGGKDIYFSPLNSLILLDIYVNKPAKQDIMEMFSVKKSPYADNSIYVPLFSAPIPFWKVGSIKKLAWLTPAQRLGLIISKPLSIKTRGLKKIEINFFPYLKHKIFELSFFNAFRIKVGY